MKKKIVLMAMTLSLMAVAHARADSYLVVGGKPDARAFSLGDVRSLKFDNGSLLVFSNGSAEAVTFGLSNLTSLKFSDKAPTSIAHATATGKGALQFANGQLTMEGANGVEAALYNVSGQRVMAIHGWDGSAVGTSSLQSGVYIFKADNQTIKFVKR